MKIKSFDRIVATQIDKCKTVLSQRGRIYNLSADRLDFFKRTAVSRQTTPEDIVGGLMIKSIDTIFSFIRNPEKAPADIEEWDEKITDAINYLHILGAVIRETGKLK